MQELKYYASNFWLNYVKLCNKFVKIQIKKKNTNLIINILFIKIN